MHKFKYFSGELSQGFVALFSGRLIQFVANGLIGLFLPIYLYIAYGYRIEYVVLFALVGHLIYTIILPFGAQCLNYIGLRNSIRASVFFFASYYISLFFLNENPLLFSGVAIIFLTIGRMMFWMPYHTDLAKFTNKSDRGKSISMMWASCTFLGVIMPLISGTLIENFGYNLVFILAISIYLTTIIPFLSLPHTQERYSWGYIETFKKFLSKENRKLVLANMANGAENAVGIIIWPIFIWNLVDGSYVTVGILSSLIVFVTVVMQLSVGKYADIFDKRKMVRYGSLFYASGWMAKVFVASSMQIFFVGTYHGFAQIFKDTPFDALNYELLADQGHLVDEYTVLKEIAVQVGKMLMLIFVAIIALNFSINWAFALAAFASIFISVI